MSTRRTRKNSRQGTQPGASAIISLRLVIRGVEQNWSAKFNFNAALERPPKLWLVRLPAIANPEAPVRRIGTRTWKLTWKAAGVVSPTLLIEWPNQAGPDWKTRLAEELHQSSAAALIFICQGKLSIVLYQRKNS